MKKLSLFVNNREFVKELLDFSLKEKIEVDIIIANEFDVNLKSLIISNYTNIYEIDIFDKETLNKLLLDSDVIVNTLNIFNIKKLDRYNIRFPELLAELYSDNKKIIHFSYHSNRACNIYNKSAKHGVETVKLFKDYLIFNINGFLKEDDMFVFFYAKFIRFFQKNVLLSLSKVYNDIKIDFLLKEILLLDNNFANNNRELYFFF